MFIKIGREEFEVFINTKHIVQIGKYQQPQCATTVTLNSSGMITPTFVVPQPPTFEYFIVMFGQADHDRRMMLTEDDYKRVIKALESAGGDYLFE